MNQQGAWQLSGDGPSAYERYIVPAYTGAWAKEIVRRAGLQNGKKVLDVACGTGLVARTAAAAYEDTNSIYGVDINTAMLKKANELNDKINWQYGDASNLPFSNSFFDVIFCQQGLQYVPDPSFAIREMKRVLADQGIILISVWRQIRYSPFYESLYRALERYVNADAAITLAAAFTLGDRRILQRLFNDAGFKRIHIELVIKQMRYSPIEAFVMGGIAASPFYKDILAMEAEQKQEMVSYLCDANDEYMDDDGLAAPMEGYIVSVFK